MRLTDAGASSAPSALEILLEGHAYDSLAKGWFEHPDPVRHMATLAVDLTPWPGDRGVELPPHVHHLAGVMFTGPGGIAAKHAFDVVLEFPNPDGEIRVLARSDSTPSDAGEVHVEASVRLHRGVRARLELAVTRVGASDAVETLHVTGPDGVRVEAARIEVTGVDFGSTAAGLLETWNPNGAPRWHALYDNLVMTFD